MASRKLKPVYVNLDDGSNEIDSLPEEAKGSYVLIGYLNKERNIIVGKLGKFRFQAGYYAYSGSAFGPGGLSARVGRHLKKRKISRWHIDYLRKHLEVRAIWFTLNEDHLECTFTKSLLDNCKMKEIIRKFGSSDCKCISHLVYSLDMPTLTDFQCYSADAE